MLKTSLKLLQKIEDNGFQAYIVGGFVRDYYLKKRSIDVDICTNATPYDLSKIFKEALLPNEQYGSVSLIYKRIRFEITTWRKEIRYEDRKPIEIEYINDLIMDLKRRDFTINTLCMNSKGEIIDELDGIHDIENKIIRIIEDPIIKLKEDPLRILRAIRFATILDFAIEPALKEAIKKQGYILKKLSYTRKKEELTRIFASPNVQYGIKLMQELGLAEYLELQNLDKIKIVDDVLGMWAQVDVMDLYPFNKTEQEIINKVNKVLTLPILNSHTLYKYGLYITSIAANIKGIPKYKVVSIYDGLKIKSRNEIKITAQQLCELLRRPPGRWITKIYNELETKIINNELENDEQTLKNYIINMDKIHTLE